MWLTGRLVPDHNTIADFRKDNGPAIRKSCARFVELCRRIGVLAAGTVAIDGSITPATDADWNTEYLDPIASVKVVGGLDEAIAWVDEHSSHHTDAIMTEDDDAARRFNVSHIKTEESPLCHAGEVLKGVLKPNQCPAFGKECTPRKPLGAPMVSSEGACAAYYNFGRFERSTETS